MKMNYSMTRQQSSFKLRQAGVTGEADSVARTEAAASGYGQQQRQRQQHNYLHKFHVEKGKIEMKSAQIKQGRGVANAS